MTKHQNYPKQLFAKNGDTKTVHTEKEHEDLGRGWFEEPQVPIKGDKGDALDIKKQSEANSTIKDGADPKKGTDAAHGLK
jgi:hypothetical protein